MTPGDLLALPADTDVAWKVVTTILPMAGDTTGFAVVARVISATLTLVAACYLGYAILSAIVRAARTGTVLAEQTSGAMGIMRVVIGFGMLVPIAGGGLSAVHYLLRDGIVRPGINAANAAAIAAAEHVLKDGHPLSPVSAGGAALAWQVAESEACLAAQRAARKNMGWTAGPAEPATGGTTVTAPATSSWWSWGSHTPARTTGYAWDWGRACGSLTLSSADALQGFGEARRAAVAQLVGEVRGWDASAELGEVVKAVSPGGLPSGGPEFEAILAASGALLRDLAGAVQRTGAAYDRTVSLVAADAVKRGADTATLREEVIRDIRERGFVALGSYYRVLAYTGLAASEAAGERAERVDPDPAAWDAVTGPVGAALRLVRAQYQREAAAEVLASGVVSDASADTRGLLGRAMSSLTEPVHEYLTGYSGWRVDPIGDLMNLGSRAMVGAQAAFAVAVAAYGASAIAGGAGGGLLDFLSVAMWPAIGAFWLGGALLSYVLPLLPFVFVFFAFAAWTLEVLVAAVAVLVWAFAHVRMDEPDFVGHAQRHGYAALLISVFLRPVVTVAAFIAAHMVNTVLLNVFLSSYNLAFQSAQIGFSLGVTGLVVSFGVLVYVQWQLVLWSYRMILTAPERVGQWLGFSVSSWGEGEAGTTVVAAATGAGRHVRAPIPKAPKDPRKDPSEADGLGASGGAPLRASGA